MKCLMGEVEAHYQPLEPIIPYRAITTSTLAPFSLSLSSLLKSLLDVNVGIKPLVPLILYYFYYYPFEVKKFDFGYVLILDYDLNFIPINSHNLSNMSPSNSLYCFIDDRSEWE